MIDVSRFHLNDRCPRCVARRVYAIDEDRNMWLCIDNARPVPAHPSQLTTHDAEVFVEQEALDRGNGLTQRNLNQAIQVIHGR